MGTYGDAEDGMEGMGFVVAIFCVRELERMGARRRDLGASER